MDRDRVDVAERRTQELIISPTLQVGGPVLVEDTCLSFDAFNELPGPYMYVQLRVLRFLPQHQRPLPTQHYVPPKLTTIPCYLRPPPSSDSTNTVQKMVPG